MVISGQHYRPPAPEQRERRGCQPVGPTTDTSFGHFDVVMRALPTDLRQPKCAELDRRAGAIGVRKQWPVAYAAAFEALLREVIAQELMTKGESVALHCPMLLFVSRRS